MTRTSSRAAAAALVLLLSACGGQPGPGLLLRLAALTPPGGCAPNGQAVPSMALGAGTLRLSVIRHDGAGSAFQCDAAAHVPDEQPNLDLGAPAGATFDVHAEFFDADSHRIGTGVLLGLSAADLASAPLPIQLYRAGSLSCPQSAMMSPRAFHSATVLPDGSVLMYGGLKAVAGAQGQFQVESDAEIFDPKQGKFAPVGGSVGRRAFHQAAYLDSAGGLPRVVFYGGLDADEVLDGTAGGTSQFRLTWKGGTAAKVTIATYDPSTGMLAAIPEAQQPKIAAQDVVSALGGAAAIPGGGLVAVGGETFSGDEVSAGLVPKVQSVQVSPGEGNPVALSILDWMVGASVTVLPDASAIAIGTARSTPTMDPAVQWKGLRLSGLSGAATSSGTFALNGSATAFHTASVVVPASSPDLAQVLVTGGFLLDPHGTVRALDAPLPGLALRLYHVAGAGHDPKIVNQSVVMPYDPSADCVTPADHYRPAGFEAASSTFSSRRVLITGGTPRISCSDCESGDSGPLCALSQVSIYDGDAGTFSRLTPGAGVTRLGVPRMGHQQVLLADGTILITGGVSHGSPTVVTPEAEVFSSRAAGDAGDVDDPVAPLLAKAGFSRSGMGTAHPCDRVQ